MVAQAAAAVKLESVQLLLCKQWPVSHCVLDLELRATRAHCEDKTQDLAAWHCTQSTRCRPEVLWWCYAAVKEWASQGRKSQACPCSGHRGLPEETEEVRYTRQSLAETDLGMAMSPELWLFILCSCTRKRVSQGRHSQACPFSRHRDSQ